MKIEVYYNSWYYCCWKCTFYLFPLSATVCKWSASKNQWNRSLLAVVCTVSCQLVRPPNRHIYSWPRGEYCGLGYRGGRILWLPGEHSSESATLWFLWSRVGDIPAGCFTFFRFLLQTDRNLQHFIKTSCQFLAQHGAFVRLSSENFEEIRSRLKPKAIINTSDPVFPEFFR